MKNLIQFPPDLAQQLRDALRLMESTTLDLHNNPSKDNEAAHGAACSNMVLLLPRLPEFMRAQDNKICQLVAIVMGALPKLPDDIAAIMTQGLIEVAPAEFEAMKQAIAVYGGKVQGHA